MQLMVEDRRDNSRKERVELVAKLATQLLAASPTYVPMKNNDSQGQYVGWAVETARAVLAEAERTERAEP